MSADKQLLRKTDFPQCAREALIKVEQLCVPQTGGRPPSAKEMDQAMDIMAEFIFCEVDRRGHRRKLTCIQQLQLAQLLCDHFSGVQSNGVSSHAGPCGDTARNTLFLSLFPPTTSKERAQALVQLVSMAISTKNQPVLDSTGIWMQQLGCTSNLFGYRLVLQLAEGLVKDYFVLVPRAVTRLQDLPTLAPHFTSNFLTTVAEMYSSVDLKDGLSPPPSALLEVVTQWVSDNPHLCLAALMVNLQPLLPLGSIPMAAFTPFAGLFKWCVLAPLHSICITNSSTNTCSGGSVVPNGKISCKKGGSDEADYDSCRNSRESPLYSQLHLALLESLAENVNSITTRDVVSAQQLASIVEPVRLWHERMHVDSTIKISKSKKLECEAFELALDRLGQAVQVALAACCVYGNKQYLLSQLETVQQFPESRLLRIILKKQAGCFLVS